jgi:SagB-type dehydrogenase family enzyme
VTTSKQSRPRSVRTLARSPNLIAYWQGSNFIVEDFGRQRQVSANPWIALLLDEFHSPRTVSSVANAFPPFTASSVTRQIHKLQRHRLLVPPKDRTGLRDIPLAWRNCFAAAYFHFASRDGKYLESPETVVEFLRRRLTEEQQPAIFKFYPGHKTVALPKAIPVARGCGLEAALRDRRTWRSFGPGKVALDTFNRVLVGTWGRTAWIDAGDLGRLIGKTSPSAGARHPIECYILAWRVAGLVPGAYHFAVGSHSLELLKPGNFRDEAVRIASSQRWIRDAAFLCVMTAVVDRVYWKYSSSDAYRLFFLDAGHLAQTFALLCTDAHLASFATAAIQESLIEGLLGLDGLKEFPLYLCGAGTRPPVGVRGTCLAGSPL